MKIRSDGWRAVFFEDRPEDERASALRRFRKKVFVDEVGWPLQVVGDEEIDEYDGRGAILCALSSESSLVGCFRAQRCDRPNLSVEVFGSLASGKAAPTDQLTWEISRFAVDRFSAGAGVKLYGLLVEFARLRAARSLIAVVDLQHERRLRQVGIVTRRFGPETVIGVDRFGRPIEAVFGEIPLPAQSTKTLFKLLHTLDNLEIQDETLVFGHTALSA
jgi:N-acyl-L-homoserine lactone synthetase